MTVNQTLPVSKWVRAKKRPLDVPVRFADCAGVINTREGEVAYVAGDAICTGVQGEQWPIDRSSFLENYTPTAPVAAGEDGLYRKIPVEVEAGQLIEDAVITNPQGNSFTGKAGDWVVRTAKGDTWVVGREIFGMSYEKIEPATDKTRVR